MPHQRACVVNGRRKEVHFDFRFLGDGEKYTGETRLSRMPMASAAPSKFMGLLIAKGLAAFLSEIGCEHGDIVVESDHEPANRVTCCGARTHRGVEPRWEQCQQQCQRTAHSISPSHATRMGVKLTTEASDHDMDGEECRLRSELVRSRRRRENHVRTA